MSYQLITQRQRFAHRVTFSTRFASHPFPTWDTSVKLNLCEVLTRHQASFAPRKILGI